MKARIYTPIVVAGLSVLALTIGGYRHWKTLSLEREEKLNLEVSQRSRIEHLLNYHELQDSVDGKTLQFVKVTDIEGRTAALLPPKRGKDYLLFIVEPTKPCASCLQECLLELSKRREFIRKDNLDILIVTCGDLRRTRMQAHLLGLEGKCYFDSSGGIYRQTGLLPSHTISLLVDRSGRVIYSCILDFKHMNMFVSFLRKAGAYMGSF